MNGGLIDEVRAAPDAMARDGSARFVCICAVEPRAPRSADPDLVAEGVTDFTRRVTRASWRPGSNDQLEEYRKGRPSRFNVPARMLYRVGLTALALPFRDTYWAPGIAYEESADGWEAGPAEPRAVRASADPVLPLHFLAAAIEVNASETETRVRDVSTTRIELRVDLSLIEDQLPKLTLRQLHTRKLRQPLSDGRMQVWMDAKGRVLRVSVADRSVINDSGRAIFWTTLEFFDFGAKIAVPDVAAGESASDGGGEAQRP